jgi:hypothetical protein
MNIKDLLETQYAQQEMLEGPLPVGLADRRALATQYAHYAGEELYSYLQAAGYKHFADSAPAPRSTRVEEIVDVLKYLLCIAWTEGVTPEELVQAFNSKTGVVYNRRKRVAMDSHVAGFDIDGVLAKYTVWGVDGTWNTTQEPFIEQGGVLGLEPNPGAMSVPMAFKERGLAVVMVTARKAWVHRRLEADTYEWLRLHNIPFDRVLFGHDKMEQIKQHGSTFRFFVEDNPKHAIDVASGGIRTYYLGTQVFGPVEHANIITVDSLHEVLERETNV